MEGGASTEEEQRAIEEDQRKHPDCFYTTSLSSSYSYVNGSSRAETLKRIIRNCPRRAPVEIYTRRDANQGQEPPPSSLPADPLPLPPFGNDLFGMLNEFQRVFEGFPFGGFHFPGQSEAPSAPHSPSRSGPEDLRPSYPPPHKFPRGRYPGAGARGNTADGVEEV